MAKFIVDMLWHKCGIDLMEEYKLEKQYNGGKMHTTTDLERQSS